MKPNKDMKTDNSQKKPATPPTPQQMAATAGRAIDETIINKHKAELIAAIQRGEDISPEAVKDYPEFAKLINKTEDSNIQPPKDFRSPKEKEVFDYLEKNLPQIENEYDNKYGDVLSQDYTKNLFESLGYDKLKPEEHSNYSRAAWSFTNYLYEKRLAERKGEGNNTVLILGGGTGSGKTTTSLKHAELSDFPIINDTNIFYLDRTEKQIDEALKNGYKVAIDFVYRVPVIAYTEGVLARIEDGGHLVSIENHAKITNGVKDNLNKIAEKCGDKIEINILDNSVELKEGEKATQISLEELNKKPYYDGKLEKILQNETKQRYESGQLAKEAYNSANSRTEGNDNGQGILQGSAGTGRSQEEGTGREEVTKDKQGTSEKIHKMRPDKDMKTDN